MIKINRVIEEQEIQDEEKEEAKRLVSLRFHRWIYVFRKKVRECQQRRYRTMKSS